MKNLLRIKLAMSLKQNYAAVKKKRDKTNNLLNMKHAKAKGGNKSVNK